MYSNFTAYDPVGRLKKNPRRLSGQQKVYYIRLLVMSCFSRQRSQVGPSFCWFESVTRVLRTANDVYRLVHIYAESLLFKKIYLNFYFEACLWPPLGLHIYNNLKLDCKVNVCGTQVSHSKGSWEGAIAMVKQCRRFLTLFGKLGSCISLHAPCGTLVVYRQHAYLQS